MAVFTPVDPAAAEALARRLGAGEMQRLSPIGEGIENTNYFLVTDQGEWVLTLFERLRDDQLPFYLGLMEHLAAQGLPVPRPRPGPDGALLHHLMGKPAALVNRLPGEHQLAPDVRHCAQLGRTLARMHLAAAGYGGTQPNLRGPAWWEATVPVVMPFLGADAAALLRDEMAHQHAVHDSAQYASLPRSAVHADLFRDNALFVDTPDGEQLSGVFDFYFAGVDTWLYDLAVCLNDWCIDLASGRADAARAEALMAAYTSLRPLTPAEHRLMPSALRAAALRFWLSRLADLHCPRDAALLTPKDPTHFERVLRHRIEAPWHPPARD